MTTFVQQAVSSVSLQHKLTYIIGTRNAFTGIWYLKPLQSVKNKRGGGTDSEVNSTYTRVTTQIIVRGRFLSALFSLECWNVNRQ